MEQLRIVYRDYGIADRFPDGTIELNKHLNDYPELKKKILIHEARHSRDDGLTKHDLMHDLTIGEQIGTFELMKFMIKHPKSLIQFSPVYYSKTRGLVYDLNNFIITGFLFAIIGIGLFIGFSV